MPWKTNDEARSHYKGLTDHECKIWLNVANSALDKCQKEGGDNCDASAIRQANGAVNNHRKMNESGGAKTMTIDIATWGMCRAAKSLGNNRIGEYGVLFGSPRLHDNTELKDYFTPETDFWLGALPKRPMIYRHSYIQDGLGVSAKFAPEVVAALEANPVIGVWDKMDKDTFGVWFEGELDTSHPAYGAMKAEVDAGTMLISSDSVLHLTRRISNQDGTHQVTRYPLVGGSLAPDPAEPRMAPVGVLNAAMKALNIAYEIPAEDTPDKPNPAAAKSAFLGDNVEGSMTMAAIDRLIDALRYQCLFDACMMSDKPLDERMKMVEDALGEFSGLVETTMKAILSGASSETPAMAAKVLELQKLTRLATTPHDGLTQTDHSHAARETARTYVERMAGFAAKKSLEGKVLPADRVAEVNATIAMWEAASGALKPLVAVAPSDDVVSLAAIRQARTERQAQVQKFHGG